MKMIKEICAKCNDPLVDEYEYYICVDNNAVKHLCKKCLVSYVHLEIKNEQNACSPDPNIDRLVNCTWCNRISLKSKAVSFQNSILNANMSVHFCTTNHFEQWYNIDKRNEERIGIPVKPTVEPAASKDSTVPPTSTKCRFCGNYVVFKEGWGCIYIPEGKNKGSYCSHEHFQQWYQYIRPIE